MAALSTEVVGHVHICSDKDFLSDAGDKDIVEQAVEFIKVTAITRCEARLCMALCPGGEHLPRRIRDYTSECTAEIKEDWTKRVHGSIVGMCTNHFQAYADTHAASAGSTKLG